MQLWRTSYAMQGCAAWPLAFDAQGPVKYVLTPLLKPPPPAAAMADALCGARARGLPWAQADAELLVALPPGAARTWRSDLLALAHELAGAGRRH